MLRSLIAAIVAAAAVAPTSASAAETVIDLSGQAPSGGPDHFFVPFEVPPGTVEIEVRHDDESNRNVLDWGLRGPNGFRGWGGGNLEPAVVGEQAASRSYTRGAIEPGTWEVIVGKARIDEEPATFFLEVVLRDEATLSPQQRGTYEHASALAQGPAWYAGDFHVHSVESGDARPPLDEIGTFARGRGLDFVLISDHNVHTAQEFLTDVQPRHPQLLFVPGVEFTTYAGHANALGATQWVDHKIGQPGVTIDAAFEAFHDQGALVSINHPTIDLGPLCIGCAWEHDVDPALVDAVEIASGGLEPFGKQFSDSAIAFWDALCARGYHVAAVGGSDDHKAGVDLNMFQSPVGDATTLVYAEALDVPSLLEGVRNGRTAVKLQGPDDPTPMFGAIEVIEGDTIRARQATLTLQVRGGAGQQLRLVRNGVAEALQPIPTDPFDTSWTVAAPLEGEDRYRVELFVDGDRRVVTSHLWLAPGFEPPVDEDDTEDSAGGLPDETTEDDDACWCRSGRPGHAWWLVVLGLVLRGRRRRFAT